MGERTIKNFWGKTVATIKEKEDGRSFIYDFWGKPLGWYDPKANNGKGATFNFWGRKIAEGDVLTSFIEKWD